LISDSGVGRCMFKLEDVGWLVGDAAVDIGHIGL
jgi:hypothetical protein